MVEEVKEESTFETIPFTNFSSEDFVGLWDKQSYFVKAGETKSYPEWLAIHFTKKLVDREMQKDGKTIIDESRLEYEKKVLGRVLSDEEKLKEVRKDIRIELEKDAVKENTITEEKEELKEVEPAKEEEKTEKVEESTEEEQFEEVEKEEKKEDISTK